MSEVINLLRKTIEEDKNKKKRIKFYYEQIMKGKNIDFNYEAISLLDETSGIYSIINTKSSKRYIGKSSNIKKRLASHLSSLQRNQHYSGRLQKDFDLLGFSVFKMNIQLGTVAQYLYNTGNSAQYLYNNLNGKII